MSCDNLLVNLPASLDVEVVDVLIEGNHVRVERIVSTGQASPEDFWYDQEEDEWVVLLKGEARLQVEGSGDLVHLQPGDHLWIPAHQKHRVEWTSPSEPTVWLAVFQKQQQSES
jgi:cupin 2 domain-containing protein